MAKMLFYFPVPGKPVGLCGLHVLRSCIAEVFYEIIGKKANFLLAKNVRFFPLTHGVVKL